MQLSKKLFLSNLIIFSLLTSNFGFVNAKAEKITELEKNIILSQANKPQLNIFDYKRGLFVANREKKHVLLTFCNKNTSCSKLYNETYANPSVKNFLEKNFVIVNIDVSSKNILIFEDKKMQEKELANIYKIDGKYPTINFLNSNSNKVSGAIKGFIPADKLLDILKYISSNSYTKMKFNEFLKGKK